MSVFLARGYKVLEKDLDKLKRIAEFSGVIVKIETIENSEKFIKGYYESQNYIVKSNKKFDSPEPNIEEYLQLNFEFEKEKNCQTWGEFLSRPGKPDYYVYMLENEIIKDFSFVECKSENEGISINQLIWYYRTNAPVKIVFTKNEIKK